MSHIDTAASGESYAVAGGIAGHVAMTEDLHSAASAIATAAGHLGEASRYVSAAVSAVRHASFAMAAHPAALSSRWAAVRVEDCLDSLLAGPAGTRRAEDTLLDIGDRLRATVLAMEQAETAAHRGMSWREHLGEAFKDWVGAVAYMPRWAIAGAWAASAPGALLRLIGKDPVLDRVAPGIPDTTGVLYRDALEAGPDLPPEAYRSLVAALALLARVPEVGLGELRLVGMAPATTEPDLAAPGSVADIVRGIEATEALGGGAVAIQQIGTGDDARYIVYIPGTSDITPWSTNPSDWHSNFTVAGGEAADSMRAVEMAMSAAGIPADAPVMLTGHSQGGIVAMALASSPEFARRFRVTHVVTTGAPVAMFAAPPSVQSLHFEHTEDIVPALDLKANGNAANQTTFSHSISQSPEPRMRQLGQELLSAHSLEGYAATAELAESGVSTSVDAFVASASGFFAPGAEVTTTAYAPVGDTSGERVVATVAVRTGGN